MTRLVSWKRARIVLAAVALLAMVLVPSVVNGTVAGWKDAGSSVVSFKAAKVGAVQNLKCIDSDDGLIPGLLKSRVQLEWERPSVPADVNVVYVVTWDAGLLGGSGTAETTDRFHLYKSGGLLTGLNVSFTVRAKIVGSSWEGPVQTSSATVLTVLGLPVLLSCN